MRQTLVEFMDSLRDYVAESGTNIAQDERDSSEFVDIFLNQGQSLHLVSGTVADAILLLEYYEKKCYKNVMGKLVLINEEYLEHYNTYKSWIEKKKNDYR